MRPSSRARGVTLLELAIVLGIIAILAGLSLASLQGLKGRATYGAITNQLVSEIKRTRLEALSRANYTAFIVDGATGSGRWWGVRTDTTFDLTTFASNPAACNTASCTIFTSGTLPLAPDTTARMGRFADTGALVYGTLPQPFNGIVSTRGCSFCDTSGWGAVLFSPGGGVTFLPTNPGSIGAQFTVTGTRDTGGRTRVKTIAIVAKNGLIEAFEK